VHSELEEGPASEDLVALSPKVRDLHAAKAKARTITMDPIFFIKHHPFQNDFACIAVCGHL
jgi:hypothetical protein